MYNKRMNPTTDEVIQHILDLARQAQGRNNPLHYALGKRGTIYDYLSNIRAHDRPDKEKIVETINDVKCVLMWVDE